MAAILCLVFLPITGAVLFLLGSMGGQASLGNVAAGLTFLLLAGGIVFGGLNMARGWDAESNDDQPA